MAIRNYSICLTPESHKHRTSNTLTPHTHQPHPQDHTPASPNRERKNSLYSKPFAPPFISVYGKETRLDQIMRLKTRPTTAGRDPVEALLTMQENQQVEPRHQPSRLEKIMALKVPKPTVVSTLTHYQPRVVPRPHKQKQNNPPPDERLWECQQAYRRKSQAEQRAERQWKQQERLRELQLQRQRKEAQREQAKQRRKQCQFQTLVQKEVRRLQRERELSKRKNGGFAIYVYPES